MTSYAMDRIGPAELLSALTLVKQGKVYDLASVLSKDMPQGGADTFHKFSLSQYHLPNALVNPDYEGYDFAMDVVTCSPHLGTHIDALIHVQYSGMIYGGEHMTKALGVDGWKKHGVETVPPIIGRGVLIDMPAYYKTDILKDGFEITAEDLEAALGQEGVTLKKGDIVLVRTGKYAEFLAGDENFFARQPGVGPGGARWLYKQGMAVLGTDTTSTEPTPFPDPSQTTHCAMLIESGVHILEIMALDKIAEDKVYEFLFIALPLKIEGASGSWLRPVALV
ncbi:MAG: cyclase family protein [Deltaproteobacteria bacterium]|jgi:kynurenine formamidase|nr:cyclase family protein [Deltaproteobacteria bacterium]